MRKISVIALVCLAATAAVRADIIPNFDGVTAGSGTNTVWNYSIDITANQEVRTNDFFTIYDFGPFVAGSAVTPAGWVFSFSLVTPPPTGTNPPDNPSLANLTWTYTGANTIATGTHISGFSVTQATSVFQPTPPTHNTFFAAQATRSTGSSAGTKVNNVGQLPVPVPVPEPTTLSLLALAGVGSALRAIRRRK